MTQKLNWSLSLLHWVLSIIHQATVHLNQQCRGGVGSQRCKHAAGSQEHALLQELQVYLPIGREMQPSFHLDSSFWNKTANVFSQREVKR